MGGFSLFWVNMGRLMTEVDERVVGYGVEGCGGYLHNVIMNNLSNVEVAERLGV
jgi:hypothetical protein